MSDQNINEALTSKTIRSSDKTKVARVIADMMGIENAESLSPEAAINAGLRQMKTARMTPEMIKVLRKMLALAQEVGVKVNMSMLPTAVKEAYGTTDPLVRDDIMRFKTHAAANSPSSTIHAKVHKQSEKGKVGFTLVGDSNDHLRRQKVKYKVDEAAVKYDITAHKDKTIVATKKAALVLRHAKERENLARQHTNQKSNLGEDAVEPEFETLDLSDEDLDVMASEITFDDIIDAMDDDEQLALVDDDTDEDIEDDDEGVYEQYINEVLSRSERMKARIRFMRTSTKRQRRARIAMNRRSDTKTINKRARRVAIKMMKQRIAKKPVNQMSVSEKERVERMLSQRKTMIDRLAIRMAPKVRKLESDRLRPSAR